MCYQIKAAEQVVLAACHLSLTTLCFAYFAFDHAHAVHKETLVKSHHIIQSICNNSVNLQFHLPLLGGILDCVSIR